MLSSTLSLYPPNPLILGGTPTSNQRSLSFVAPIHPPRTRKPIFCSALKTHEAIIASALLATGFVSALVVGPASAATELPILGAEPSNALSLPTWAVHVSSVAEWITAMALVWRYGERPGFEAWKGLSWGMVPLLGGAMCACTWHFFYNAESLEVLVALQAALTVIGNATMCIAAYRIYKSQESSEAS